MADQLTYLRRKSSANSAAIRAGHRYEARVQAHLAERFGRAYAPSLWISYQVEEQTARRCQLDGLLTTGSALWIIEIKVTHSQAAFDQLLFYHSICRHIFPDFPIGLLEICSSFDPATRTECPSHLQWYLEPARWTLQGFNVHELNERTGLAPARASSDLSDSELEALFA